MAAPSDPSQPKSPAASRRGFMGSIAAAATFFGITRGRSAGAETPGGHTADQIALRDRANVAASRQRRQASASAYQPLTGGIVHFFGYGQSLSQGFDGAPVLSSQQPYDNLMIGGSTRAANNAYTPAATTWVPVGSTDSSGVYPFEPMIATPESPYASTSGETPGEGAINFLRNVYLQQLGLSSNSACQFVLTNCGIGNQTIAELSKGADPEVFNRLRNAASCVQQAAASLGLSYQVGGMIWTHGETDVARNTPYASYLASLQQLQADFLTDIVQAIAGQPSGVTIPWFTDQPDSNHAHHPIGVHQALLDWSNTPDSDLYMAGPVYQYPDRSVHLTANGYRWHANQVGRAMANVILNGQSPTPLCMTSATFQGTSVLINFSVPVPPLIQGDSYIQFTQAIYPALGFIVSDSAGNVPITSAAIVGAATVQIILGRALRQTPSVQSGFNRASQTDWGTNICDSDPTLGNDLYVYTPGVQLAGEDIATWNGAPLIGQPYPLNNYLAVGAVTITPD